MYRSINRLLIVLSITSLDPAAESWTEGLEAGYGGVDGGSLMPADRDEFTRLSKAG